jgi:polysaccharide biosynthesis protein PslH
MLEGGAPGRCAVGLLTGLIDHGLDVSAVAARQAFGVQGAAPTGLPVEIVPVEPERHNRRAQWERVRHPRGELGRGPFARRIRQLATTVDILHLEEVETGWCDQGVTAPALVHVHYLVRRDRSFGSPIRAPFRQVAESASAEWWAARRHRYLVASSPIVAEHLRYVSPKATVVVAPLSLHPAHYPRASLGGPPTAGIVGTAAWPPTAAAMRRLVDRVWPRVRRRVPEARLLIAGRGTERLQLRGNGVEVVGEVASAAEFLGGLSLLLYPIERGSGMKVKVLEAIATGLPVVTTLVGAEGIWADGGVVTSADDQGLADAAIEVLLDAEARRQRGAESLRAFQRRYTPLPATEPLVWLYKQMVS